MDVIPKGSGEKTIVSSRKEVFVLMKDKLKNGLGSIIEHLGKNLSEKNGSTVIISEDMKPGLAKLFGEFRSRWETASRTEARFFNRNKAWLETSVPFPVAATTSETPKNKGGRPSKEFESSSERSKRRKTEEVRTALTLSELGYAFQMSLRSTGKIDASKVVKDVTLTSPSRATKYRAAFKSSKSVETRLSEDAALSVLVEYKLSRSQYQGIKSVSKENNCKLYPPYHNVLRAKKRCYPEKDAITVTESTAEVELQALLDHTLQRILILQDDVIRSLGQESVRNMEFICKWGCDGSSGQSKYKQNFSDDTKSDAHVFLTSVVPLQLVCVDPASNAKVVVWQNPRTSFQRFCRPLRLQFLHENTESTVNEVRVIEDQIKTLVPFTTVLHGREISITSKMAFTMIDGKVCNAVSTTKSAQRCYLCGATSKDFDNIDAMLKKHVDESNIQFGLSTLHAWIRFFECCLHLSYKLEMKKWQARSVEEKRITEIRKRIVQKEFKTRLGLIVDRPKPGFGSTNDGNTARRFFERSDVSASITGVDQGLIERFYIILQAISSGHEIDCVKFKEYTVETAKTFDKLYSWYYMPTSVHKVLIHGPQIIAAALLPIGMLSEDAQEARNKYIKRFRENFARKCSMEETMRDVFNRLLVTSDPYISSIRKLPGKPLRSLSAEAVKLLLSPTVANCAGVADHPTKIDSESDMSSESDSDSG